MKLLGSLASPYVRKVRIVMAEKKLEYEFVLEDVWSPDSTIAEANPLGKVPCLIMEDGGAMFDQNGQAYTTNGAFQWQKGKWVFVAELPSDNKAYSQFLRSIRK